MTFAGGIAAVWSSGCPDDRDVGRARSSSDRSGATGTAGSWSGALAGRRTARSSSSTAPGRASSRESACSTGYGRLRTPVQGPDGSLYVTTSNGGDDKILRVTPS